jgi:hypothetical protein
VASDGLYYDEESDALVDRQRGLEQARQIEQSEL